MGRLILQEQIERGMLMKFLSIFSARRDASGKTRIAPVTNKINVEEAVRLFQAAGLPGEALPLLPGRGEAAHTTTAGAKKNLKHQQNDATRQRT